MGSQNQNLYVLRDTKASALIVDRSGRVVDHSPSGRALADIWLAGNGPLQALVDQSLVERMPVEDRLVVDGMAKLWLAVIPQGDTAVIIGRDTTVPDKVTEALLKSRTMLKELLDNSVDLAFEVDRHQIFKFLAPQQSFGFKTEDWLGIPADKFFWPDGDMPSRNPLAARTFATHEAVAVKFHGDEKRWITFSVQPRYDDNGELDGVRGTCRDVTDHVEKERQTRLNNLRLTVQSRITRILNVAETPDELLDSAALAIQDVLRADAVWVLINYGRDRAHVSVGDDDTVAPDFDAIWGQLERAEDMSITEMDVNGRTMLVLSLLKNGKSLGAVIVSRETSVSPWSRQEEELLGDVGDVLMAAFEKASLIDKLYRLSSRDELTDILNRRAITEAVEKRLKYQCRTGKAGCLVFIDLDHFKEVNDTLGHKAGDDALKHVAEYLEGMIRPNDYAGRFGGDEFILWLEDLDEGDAANKARSLIDEMPAIREKIGNANLGLSASIGICRSTPGEDLSFQSLADRADAALYDVKKSGKGDIAFATDSTGAQAQVQEAS